MTKKSYATLMAVILLSALIVMSLGQENIVYGRGKGLSPAKYRALPAAARTLADRAKTDLARELGVAADRIVVQSVDPVNHPDTSLGVLEPGKRYLQALTPGYAVRLMADGKTYTYHGSDDRIIRVPSEGESDGIAQRLLRSSVSDLQNRLDVSLDEIVVQHIEAVEFADGSLGVPEPNVPYPLGPTPGYEIRLQATGAVYRYWAAGDRVVYVGSFVEPTRMVTVYLHKELNSGSAGCGQVYPVERSVPVTSEPSGVVALGQLFAGPTEAEVAQGYRSPFSKATQGMLKDIKVKGRTAYLDLADVRPVMPMAGSACGREAFLAEVEATLKAVLPVEWVVYSIKGDPLAFCEWMQLGCDGIQ